MKLEVDDKSSTISISATSGWPKWIFEIRGDEAEFATLRTHMEKKGATFPTAHHTAPRNTLKKNVFRRKESPSLALTKKRNRKLQPWFEGGRTEGRDNNASPSPPQPSAQVRSSKKRSLRIGSGSDSDSSDGGASQRAEVQRAADVAKAKKWGKTKERSKYTASKKAATASLFPNAAPSPR
jgi:hypothetical protein